MAEAIQTRLRDNAEQVACAAPTGVAASLLNGRTLHNLFSLPLRRIETDVMLNPLTPDQLMTTRKRFKNSCLLIIDEMSMLNTTTLHHVHTRLQQINQSTEPFGGIPIVLMGDMFQLPPCPGEPMYKTVFKEPKLQRMVKSSYLGSELFQSFAKYELTQQMRCKDPIHTDLISEMRNSDNLKKSLLDFSVI